MQSCVCSTCRGCDDVTGYVHDTVSLFWSILLMNKMNMKLTRERERDGGESAFPQTLFSLWEAALHIVTYVTAVLSNSTFRSPLSPSAHQKHQLSHGCPLKPIRQQSRLSQGHSLTCTGSCRF